MFELFQFSLYILYGFVFIAIGFSILFRDMRFSHLSIATALPSLAVFGFIHGLHEISELYLIVYQQDILMHNTVKLFKVIKLWVSFIALGCFAMQMLTMTQWQRRDELKKLIQVTIILFIIYFCYQFAIKNIDVFLNECTLYIRWLFGSGSGLLAGLALINYSKKLKFEERQASHAVQHLGISIILYGLFAGIFYIDDLFYGVPIRGGLAFVILIYLQKTMALFDAERQTQIERALQKALHNKKLSDVGELTSGIAHEIKTPLSSALMRCDILEKQINTTGSSAADFKPQLEHIRKGLLKAAHISQELLQFSHKRAPVIEEISVSVLIDEALQLMVHRLDEFDIRVLVPNDLHVFADKEQIEEVVVNILNNAIDASTDKKVVCIEAQQKGLNIHLSITDFGSGIDDSIKDKVTMPFFTTKAKGSGTGLGLTLCQKILEQNHARFWFQNTSDGLCVVIELPMEYSWA
ncbi:HAMP domain-containing histidine kinase [Vibrio genomosp. F6]|uniref:sensor histidine kinase n=1 Tax=Vibrio genomosp. F6 TaxID=723172 RepID=UPI0010BD39C6|nr:HAMP domain-containing sensor histidine kinase [Vibrio genomosp. F6]TKF21328.1 HAMP domain-containing histidine kinase [Vibrio genomosp. F6]